LDLALDVADSIQAQDSLEKMLVHQMAVLHRGMMRATARMNEELYAAAGLDEGRREAANVRACRSCNSRYIHTCCDMAAAMPWRTRGTTHGRYRPGSVTRTSSTRCVTLSWPRIGLRTSGDNHRGSRAAAQVSGKPPLPAILNDPKALHPWGHPSTDFLGTRSDCQSTPSARQVGASGHAKGSARQLASSADQ
jgi:hypothetical protein